MTHKSCAGNAFCYRYYATIRTEYESKYRNVRQLLSRYFIWVTPQIGIMTNFVSVFHTGKHYIRRIVYNVRTSIYPKNTRCSRLPLLFSRIRVAAKLLNWNIFIFKRVDIDYFVVSIISNYVAVHSDQNFKSGTSPPSTSCCILPPILLHLLESLVTDVLSNGLVAFSTLLSVFCYLICSSFFYCLQVRLSRSLFGLLEWFLLPHSYFLASPLEENLLKKSK